MNINDLLSYTISTENDCGDKLHYFLHIDHESYTYRMDKNRGNIKHIYGKFWSCIIVMENGFEVDRRNVKNFLENRV